MGPKNRFFGPIKAMSSMPCYSDCRAMERTIFGISIILLFLCTGSKNRVETVPHLIIPGGRCLIFCPTEEALAIQRA